MIDHGIYYYIVITSKIQIGMIQCIYCYNNKIHVKKCVLFKTLLVKNRNTRQPIPTLVHSVIYKSVIDLT